jgi:hypothetical protein
MSAKMGEKSKSHYFFFVTFELLQFIIASQGLTDFCHQKLWCFV